MDLKATIREVPNFPKEGILFFDVTTLFLNPQALESATTQLADHFRDHRADVVLGIESRGFVVGALVAQKLGLGLGLLRKPGKLPYRTVREEYSLEYGTDSLEMHVDAVPAGKKALIIDDLLATGGTVNAVCNLVERVGGKVVGCGFIIELDFLNGREKLEGREVFSLVHYASEAM